MQIRFGQLNGLPSGANGGPPSMPNSAGQPNPLGGDSVGFSRTLPPSDEAVLEGLPLKIWELTQGIANLMEKALDKPFQMLLGKDSMEYLRATQDLGHCKKFFLETVRTILASRPKTPHPIQDSLTRAKETASVYAQKAMAATGLQKPAPGTPPANP